MRFFLESTENPSLRYEAVDFDPKTKQVTLAGPLAKISVSLADGSFRDHGYRLAKEDGSDAQLEELQAQLQTGGSHS